MRKFFDEAMKELEISLIKLCNCSTDSISNLKEQLTGTESCYTKAKELFQEAETLAAHLEGRCVRLLIHQQPVASDLRKIKSTMSVMYDLVRIAEMSSHTVRMGIKARDELPEIIEMLEKAEIMVLQATECYLKRNVSLAKEVIAEDDSVDEMFIEVRHELIQLLKKTDDSDDWVLDSLLLAKYLERIADHAVNIAQGCVSLG